MTISESESMKNTRPRSREDELGSHDQDEANTRGKSPEISDPNGRESSEEGELEETSIEQNEWHNQASEDLGKSSVPPLPSEPLPETAQEIDDGWAPIWEEKLKGFYFYNRFTGASQWTNPRVPEPSAAASTLGPPGVDTPSRVTPAEPPPVVTSSGYNPAIHGDYDPNAWYARPSQTNLALEISSQTSDLSAHYTATAAFNRFTGRFQNPEITAENFNDENKSKRQMNAFFDVDAAANSHDGRSLKAERSSKKLSKSELKQFKEKRKMKKEERRRAWLRD
ncbi:putative ww domain protein [Golovinomyces cichoracearum]|uniref:Putative ww domain protein n=1 Tax=Golovinomyces cichoracearum TaxID=62708 RepID=A0A420HI42_9PEZI|nr:putative ww domain protein [Golovinomyces cichoracearum]